MKKLLLVILSSFFVTGTALADLSAIDNYGTDNPQSAYSNPSDNNIKMSLDNQGAGRQCSENDLSSDIYLLGSLTDWYLPADGTSGLACYAELAADKTNLRSISNGTVRRDRLYDPNEYKFRRTIPKITDNSYHPRTSEWSESNHLQTCQYNLNTRENRY